MAKKRIVLVGARAQQKVRAGVNFLADAVKLTYGPYGRNFASGVHGGPIAISNDGVSLAKEMVGTARDEFEEIGLRAAVEAATKTNDAVGDGTTASVILTQAILKSATFDPDVIGARSSMEVAEIIKQESALVVEKLNAMAKPVESREHLIKIAKVSVESDSLAELIGGAQWEVGKDGVVLAEEHNKPEDEVEYVNGVRWDNGFTTSRIINNQEKQTLELADVHVILTNKVFTKDNVNAFKDLITELIKDGAKHAVLMGRGFDEPAIGLCVKNIQEGFPLYPINAPYTNQDKIMEDMAAALGGRYINTAERNIESISKIDVGFARKLVVKRFEGTVIGPKRGEDARIDALVAGRLEAIEQELMGDISPFERRMLTARASQLKVGTAIVKVGAETESERRYKKDKVDDAVNAVKAAFQEGVVSGAGWALMLVADAMPEESIITDALRAPYKQIMANAGNTFIVDGSIQDPLRVVRTAFEKASSIARQLSTIEVLTNWQEEKPRFVQEATQPADDIDD